MSIVLFTKTVKVGSLNLASLLRRGTFSLKNKTDKENRTGMCGERREESGWTSHETPY